MNDIDSMDMLGYLHLRAWNTKNEKKAKAKPKRAYIDEVWNMGGQ